jgi:hypothetical protein
MAVVAMADSRLCLALASICSASMARWPGTPRSVIGRHWHINKSRLRSLNESGKRINQCIYVCG